MVLPLSNHPRSRDSYKIVKIPTIPISDLGISFELAFELNSSHPLSFFYPIHTPESHIILVEFVGKG